MQVNTQQYLNEVEKSLQNAIDVVKLLTQNINPVILNTPEAAGKWSMLQCIKHISLATSIYVRNVGEILAKPKLPGAKENFKGHWKGKWFAKMNAPKPGGEIPMKLKTFKSMEPAGNLNAEEIIDEFIKVHQQMIEVVNRSRIFNIDRIKVVTALGPMVKLRLGEAYRFITAHTDRHLVQLKRIEKTVNR